jgi:ferredoxin-NADP reductase
MTNRPARVVWSAMYLAVAAAILWYRFAVPLVQASRHQMRVVAVHAEAPGVVSIVVTGRDLDRLRATAGQFFRWRFLTRDLWWASNPYSLSAAPRPNSLRITVKDLGEHSAALMRVRPGTRVLAEGPYGAMTPARRTRRKVLLIAGGIGITPIRALFESMPAGPADITLIYRVRREADVVFRDELAAIARQRGARLLIVAGRRGELGWDPLSAEVLTATVPDLREHDVYICGPDRMTEAVTRSLRTARVRRGRIHSESFTF